MITGNFHDVGSSQPLTIAFFFSELAAICVLFADYVARVPIMFAIYIAGIKDRSRNMLNDRQITGYPTKSKAEDDKPTAIKV